MLSFSIIAQLILIAFSIPPPDCPTGGIYMSPDGNDATGTGTDYNPFKTFQKSLETLEQNDTDDGIICLLSGTYTEVPTPFYTYGPFRSIWVVPAYLSALPTLDTFWFSLHDTTSVSISNFNIRNLSLYASHSEVHLHDLYGANSKVSIFDVSTDPTLAEYVLEGIYGGISLKIGTQKVIHSISLLSSDFTDISIDAAANVTLFGNILSSYVTIFHSSVLTVSNCSATNLILKDELTQNFISSYPPKNAVVSIANNLFSNITIYTQTKSTTNLVLVNSPAYTLNYENNTLICLEGRSLDNAGVYPLPYIPFSVDNPGVKANIMNNLVTPCQ